MVSPDRPGSALSSASTETEKEDIWGSMLQSVASSKRLPQKSILVLGGSEEQQKEFVESLGKGTNAKGGRSKEAPVANEFALGYTYLDVEDKDHEDVLARLGLYIISEPTPAFVPLLRPLFTPQLLPETLVVILLDWAAPWDWMRQIKTWVLLMRGIFTSLDDECRMTLDDVTRAWMNRRGTFVDGGGGGGGGGGAGGAGAAGAAASVIAEVNLPLGPGEFDEPIGLPLCVVCQNADKIELLERERGWKEEEFDFVLQFLRTVLLKHGASLIYTTPSVPSAIQPMIYSMLSIQTPLRQTLKHNVIERDKVVVPPHWDSWGKIRVLREGFDVEGISQGWSIDVDQGNNSGSHRNDNDNTTNNNHQQEEIEGGAVEVYEEVIRDSRRRTSDTGLSLLKNKGLEVPPVDTQEFLSIQMEALEAKAAEEKATRGATVGKDDEKRRRLLEEGQEKVIEHVGPVQFNVGGIQVDAENMLERLKEREANRERLGSDDLPPLTASGGAGSAATAATSATTTEDGKSQNEVLSAFFNSLMGKQAPKKGKP